MMARKRIYESSSGDTWDLIREDEDVFVRHQPNRASGGAPSRIELAAFLRADRVSAESAALTRMIASLVDRPA